jgi:glycosyltransferase involved in cell wall biosynthesis
MAERLTVALDGTPLVGPVGGIRRFTDQLLLSLREEFPGDNYLAVSDQFAPTPKGLERRWWLFGLNRALQRCGAQVFHGTDFAVPYWGKLPSVMTVHDLSPWLEPGPGSARVRQRTGLLLRAKIPTIVHTPTEAVRQEVLARFGWAERRVVAIPHAASALFAPAPERCEPYFLYLGTLEARKNLEVLYAATRLLWEQGTKIPLRLAGHRREGYLIPDHPGIEYLGPQEDGMLSRLYSSATAVLYPSRYEGFGLPVLEAMQCGAAVVCSAIPALLEVGDSAVLFAGVEDAAEWASCMKKLAEDVALREERQQRSLARAAQFSWAETAKKFRGLYERCLSEA